MKKFSFLVLSVYLMMISCTKREDTEKEIQKDLLIKQVSDIVNLNVVQSNPDDFMMMNCNNPYDQAGIITSKITYEVLSKARDNKSDPNMLRSEFINTVSSTLSASNLSLDTVDYNDVEFIIENFLIDIYVKEGFSVFVIKSKEIENIVNKSPFFNIDQKKRVLMFSSMLRHNINMIQVFFIENSISKSGPWSDCFFDKLRELEDCRNCWVERIFCITSWPTCLGVKALDCAIDAIF